jgi:hypothetical protein
VELAPELFDLSLQLVALGLRSPEGALEFRQPLAEDVLEVALIVLLRLEDAVRGPGGAAARRSPVVPFAHYSGGFSSDLINTLSALLKNLSLWRGMISNAVRPTYRAR